MTKSRDTIKATLKAAFPNTLPVMAGYLVLGFGFGLLLNSNGYSFVWAFFMSLTIYAGSMQYVAIDLLSSGAGLITCAIMTVLINARHLFYGISMLARYRKIKRFRLYDIFALTDETYSLVCSAEPPEGTDGDLFYFFTSALDQCYWLLGSTAGAIFGQVVKINTTGVDFSMTALFVVIFIGNLLKRESRVPALLGLGISLLCLLLFGSSGFLIPSMIGITAVLMLLRPVLAGKEGES